jgi:CRISPR-associated protein Cmr5
MKAATRTLEQKRAEHALRKIREIDNETADGLGSSYQRYVESLPATIVMNGLGQACAILLAHSNGNSSREKAYRLLYDHLEEWLCQSENAVYRSEASLIDAIVKNDQQSYVRAQAEALAYLDWLKKFAQAFLKQKPASAAGASDAE